MQDQRKPVYFFLHIPKTGGSSLSDLLNRIYHSRYIRVMDGNIDANWERVGQILSTTPDKYDVITAHVAGFGVHKLSPRPVRYITILREPAARVISLYYKIMRNTADRRHAELAQYETIDKALPHIRTNLQTRLIAGAAPDAPLQPADLETAKRNLETWFDSVAILERFEESLLQMRHAMSWRRIVMAPPHLNVGRNRPKSTPGATRQLARELNDYDVELYRFANELLDNRIRALGLAYTRDKFELQARRALSRLKSSVTRRLRRRAVP